MFSPLMSLERVKRRQHTRRCFTQEEDEKLKELVNVHGAFDWETIASHMPDRNPRQCRDRYTKYLASNLNRNSWTKEDDERLLQKYAELGNRWSVIASFFEGRTDVQIYNRIMCLSRAMRSTQRKKAIEETKIQEDIPVIDDMFIETSTGDIIL